MAAKKNAVDKSKLSPTELAAYEKRLEAARSPRPAYIAYTVDEAGNLEIHSVTRVAEEILQIVDANRDLKYKRFEIK